jgi:capsular exopolysaccharide synthesis family protein
MGRIHEALQRAEEQREKLGGAPGGPASAREILDRAPESRGLSNGRLRGGTLRAARRSRVVLSDAESAVTEQYRTLRARIQSIRRARPLRSIVITSALAGEGKTTTAVNLALSFGLDLERESCLVDADLRTPSVHRALSELPPAGLAELLEEEAKLEEVLVRVPDTRLWVLPVRSLPAHPSELLASRRMVRLLDDLHERFETVLIDAPPVLGLPDATTLVDLCDATLFVISRGRASRSDLESALERIDAGKVLGTVFNRATETPPTYGSARADS